jgi:uncharacterized membrane protein YdjX (TVP38/TMEM64 family)/rhodanese-related sulfurtransferase
MTLRTIVSRLLLALAVAGAATALALNRGRLDPVLIERSIHDLGVWAPVGHIALFALATVLFVPGSVFGLAGGALFGPIGGTIFNLAGATVGATAAFLIARHLAADWVRATAGGRLERLAAGVEAEGWRFVAFVRLVPLVPFNLLNYALGLTRIPLAHYLLASLVCMAPGTLAYTWLGHAGRAALAGHDTALRFGLPAVGLLVALGLLPRLVRRLRGSEPPQWIDVDELAGRLERGRGPAVIDVRGPDEFVGPLGHIAGARNLPVGELPQRLKELDALKREAIVLVCRTDRRSSNAAALLREAGFRDVRVLRGGMMQWNQAGRPVEDRARQPQP